MFPLIMYHSFLAVCADFIYSSLAHWVCTFALTLHVSECFAKWYLTTVWNWQLNMLILRVILWMGIENWLFMRQNFSKMWLTCKDGPFVLPFYNTSFTEVFALNGTNLRNTGPRLDQGMAQCVHSDAFWGSNDECLDRLDVFLKFSVKLQKWSLHSTATGNHNPPNGPIILVMHYKQSITLFFCGHKVLLTIKI